MKDHFHPFQKMENYDKMVLLLRNPFHAILAEFQRIRAGHTGIIDNIPLKGDYQNAIYIARSCATVDLRALCSCVMCVLVWHGITNRIV